MKTIVAVFFLIAIQMNLTIIQSKRILMFSNHRDRSEKVRPIIDYRMPKSCLRDYTPYCFEKGDNYPDTIIANLLQNMTDLHISTQDNEIDHREGNEEPECPSIATDKRIYYIIDKSDKVRVVVQMLKKFEQIYTVRWCQNEGEIKNETQHLFNTTLRFNRMECVNMKLNYDFFVLGYDEVSLERVQAKGGIPVCCRCRQMD